MRALVTGCAGFIGSHLTESLLGDGLEVVGVDCFNDNYARPQKLRNIERAREWDHFDFVPIDLARGDLHDFVSDCDVLFHLAAEPGVRSSWGSRFETYVRNNLISTQHLLDAATASGDKRFVFASSSSIYGQAETFPTHEDTLPQPLSPYGATKLAAEHLCGLYHANYGISTVSLRFFSVYGPRQRPDMAFTIFCKAAVDRRPITVFGDGRQTRDFTFVGDVVQAVRRAAEAPDVEGRVYNVGGGSQIGVNDALGMIGQLAGRRLEVNYVEREYGDVRDTAADTARARSELGFEPQTAFKEGLSAQFDWALEEQRRDAAGLSGARLEKHPREAGSAQPS
ncbi:MAG: GDP-mannose 4,6-dehydratase [Actinomycetota bacterium]|nr:GDP-mannose 4,6-dehydratase [Actinomycetota bacterium]